MTGYLCSVCPFPPPTLPLAISSWGISKMAANCVKWQVPQHTLPKLSEHLIGNICFVQRIITHKTRIEPFACFNENSIHTINWMTLLLWDNFLHNVKVQCIGKHNVVVISIFHPQNCIYLPRGLTGTLSNKIGHYPMICKGRLLG